MKSAISAKKSSTAGGLAVRTLIVPVDFSEPSRAAFEKALEIADHFEASIRAIHVLEHKTSPDFDAFPLAVDDKAVTQSAKQRLVKFAQTGTHASVPVYPEVREGRAWEQIVQAARREQVEMIVISTHGYTGIKHALLGSTTERVVRHAPCAVLVVRSHEASQPKRKSS